MGVLKRDGDVVAQMMPRVLSALWRPVCPWMGPGTWPCVNGTLHMLDAAFVNPSYSCKTAHASRSSYSTAALPQQYILVIPYQSPASGPALKWCPV